MANLGCTAADLDTYLSRLGSKDPGHALAQALSDRTFRRPARRLADTAAQAGIPTYAYQSAWPVPHFGAAHCTDLPFVFDHLNAPQAPELLDPTPPSTRPQTCTPHSCASPTAITPDGAPTPPKSAAPWSSTTTPGNAPTVSPGPPTNSQCP